MPSVHVNFKEHIDQKDQDIKESLLEFQWNEVPEDLIYADRKWRWGGLGGGEGGREEWEEKEDLCDAGTSISPLESG